MGYKQDAIETYVLALIWLIVFVALTFLLASRLDEMDAAKEIGDRKLMEFFKSIVQAAAKHESTSDDEDPRT